MPLRRRRTQVPHARRTSRRKARSSAAAAGPKRPSAMQRAIGSLLRSLRPSSPEALLSAASPHVLFAADAPELREQLAEWQVVTDVDIGGTSKASFELVHLGDGDGGDGGGGIAGRFSGSLLKPAAGVRGFCALKSPTWAPPRELGEVESIEVRARANGAEARRFLLNLKVESFNPDDMYQGAFVLDPAKGWTTLRLPLSEFALTARGRHLNNQRRPDGDLLLESVGLLALADDERADFSIDVVSVAAMPHEIDSPFD